MVTVPSSAAYFSRAEPYLRRNYRIQLRSEILHELIGEPKGKRILDLGCGNGAVSLPLARDNEVTLVDNSQAMLDAAAEVASRLGVRDYTAIRSDAAGLDLAPVDIIIALGLLAHVDSAADVIASISKLLKPGGRAILQFSDGSRLLNKVGRLMFAVRGRSYQRTDRDDVLKAARSSGLRLLDERSHLLFVPGMPRLLGRALLPYDRLVRRHPALAGQGLDTILLLEKTR